MVVVVLGMEQTMSPTLSTISPARQAKLRAMDGHARLWVDYDRAYSDLPIGPGQVDPHELRDCDFCEVGVAELTVEDYDPDCGASYEPANGSSRDADDRHVFYCAACTAAGNRLPEAA